MCRFLMLIILLIPFSVFAKDYADVAVKISPEEGTVTGVLDVKGESSEFDFDLKDADYNDGNTFVIYKRWMPKLPDGMGLRMHVSLPDKYMYVTENDRIATTPEGMRLEFDKPDDGITLAFSNQWIKDTVEHRTINISTFFTKNNSRFSKAYFARIKELLDIYTVKLSKYPYDSFKVIDVPYPAGHALKSMTFISGRIIGMPFLTNVSLGHELVHQWFGVGVKADYEEGNWAEGLTTYLADRLYAEMKGEGAEYRKNALLSYMAHARQKEDGTCLMEFKYNKDKTAQAIGYAKGMMVFAMLEAMIGSEDFDKGIKVFIERFMGQTASWDDIIAVFEDVSGVHLRDFIDGWLADTALAELNVTKPQVKAVLNGYEVSFDVMNKHKWLEYPLEVLVKTESGKEFYEYLYIKDSKKSVTIKSDSKPVELIFDPEYRVARYLSDGEATPVLHNLFSKYKKIVFVNPDIREVYIPLIMSLKNAEVVSDEANPSLYTDRIMVFAGKNNRAFRKLYGDMPKFDGKFMVKSYKHPMGLDRMSYLVLSSNMKQTSTNVRRIVHYGKYSSLMLKGGRTYEKQISDSDKGLAVKLSNEKMGVAVTKPLSVKDIVDLSKDKKVFLIGESHDQFAHHENQLEFIRQLTESGRDLAIGLEMFQRPFQKVLDGYLSGDISQAEMLKKSEYYDRWRFDFRLYKRIIDYSKSNNIPLIALNLDTKITKKISSGGILSLSDEERAAIPQEIQYTGGIYKEYLQMIFNMHAGKRKFEHFYEAQLLWDETMAETAAEYIKANPDKTMVILAGNGHVRFGHGIADRVKRRTGLDYLTVLQDEDYEAGVADYILYPDEVEYEPAPKIGVMVDETDEGLQVKKVLSGKLAEKAGVEDGDYITEFNGHRINNLSGIRIALLYAEKGETYSMKVLRKGEELTFSVSFE